MYLYFVDLFSYNARQHKSLLAKIKHATLELLLYGILKYDDLPK